ncbi:alpha-tectorin-like [Entelurus aequoreus]|uniref:alpha-tectorin-like n=1 Tax=Entelurus aequoreus TaxID=161455 RepID=UPI002B1DB23B|nr:alpha-tectorin-like [Entelurus aequoreus]XP_061915703.1 alpha-tectorin-like [Entelurus aequoreus]XP_061915704.1 alpha-tectorin-like [Entelurus aequoreus]XP_061915705.1 alpha-tectorin-like [Entelurus aequoreus]
MLLLLVVTTAFSLLPGASAQFMADFDASSCPINFYGQTYSTLFVDIAGGMVNVCFDEHNGLDCFHIAHTGPQNGAVSSFMVEAGPGSEFHTALPELTGTSPCYTVLEMTTDTGVGVFAIYFRTFGQQGSIRFNLFEANLDAEVQVSGLVVDHWESVESTNHFLVSGCRHEDQLQFPDTRACDFMGSFIKCNASAYLDFAPQPNDYCVRDASLCTVSGSTVINNRGGSTSIPNHCAYDLVEELDMQMVGVFNARRRKDVMFLEYVLIDLGDAVIKLGQGGKVKVNDEYVDLGNVSEIHSGVELYKDITGVSAMLSHDTYNTKLYFDGNSAVLYTVGPGWVLKEDLAGHLNGLCVNESLTLNEAKSYLEDCEVMYSEPADESINCTTVTEHCHVMNGSDFADCHAHVDPEPYIAACIQTRCNYTDLDGVKCMFHEAYAKACSLKNHSVDGWRSNAQCPAHEIFCPDNNCLSHEFCADDINGQTACFCRALSEFKMSETVGNQSVCLDNNATLTVAGCLLEERGIDYTKLHLNDESCRGHKDMYNMVNFYFNTSNNCGAVVMVNDSKIFYKNTVMRESMATPDGIMRYDSFHLDFSCFLEQPDINGMTFKIKDNSVVQTVMSGSFEYILNMTTYLDSNHTQALDVDTEILLNQTVFVKLMTAGLDENLFSVVVDSCWATSGPSPTENPMYYLIIDGCANSEDETVRVDVNGLGPTSSFSFNMFQFYEDRFSIYLHCKIHLCLKANQICSPNCSSSKKRRRSLKPQYVNENPSLISMALTK